MTWQLLIGAYMVFSTATYLLRRTLAQAFSHHNQLVNIVFFLGFLYPAALLVSRFVPHNLDVGLDNLLILASGSLIFPIFNLMAYKAGKELDVGLTTVVSNLAPVVTITGATLLLHERLNAVQLVGAALLIASSVVVALPNINMRKVKKAHADAVWLIVGAVLLLGMGLVFERFMLKRIDFGAYLVYGWGAQSLWATCIAFYRKVDIRALKQKQVAKPILLYGLVNMLKSICFIGALKLTTNASVVSALTSFVAILVVLAAYVFLREREALWLKFGAALVSSVGLYLL